MQTANDNTATSIDADTSARVLVRELHRLSRDRDLAVSTQTDLIKAIHKYGLKSDQARAAREAHRDASVAFDISARCVCSWVEQAKPELEKFHDSFAGVPLRECMK